MGARREATKDRKATEKRLVEKTMSVVQFSQSLTSPCVPYAQKAKKSLQAANQANVKEPNKIFRELVQAFASPPSIEQHQFTPIKIILELSIVTIRSASRIWHVQQATPQLLIHTLKADFHCLSEAHLKRRHKVNFNENNIFRILSSSVAALLIWKDYLLRKSASRSCKLLAVMRK